MQNRKVKSAVLNCLRVCGRFVGFMESSTYGIL